MLVKRTKGTNIFVATVFVFDRSNILKVSTLYWPAREYCLTFMCLVTSLLWDWRHVRWGNEQKLFFHYGEQLLDLIWHGIWYRDPLYVACGHGHVLIRPFALQVGQIRHAITLPKGLYGPPIDAFSVKWTEESGKEGLKFPMNCGIALD